MPKYKIEDHSISHDVELGVPGWDYENMGCKYLSCIVDTSISSLSQHHIPDVTINRSSDFTISMDKMEQFNMLQNELIKQRQLQEDIDYFDSQLNQLNKPIVEPLKSE